MTEDNHTKTLHRLIRFISSLAVSSFFSEVRVVGGENVPKEGPIIVTATHHNMMLDPVILSVGFPYQRMLNYWSKASLFANPVMRWILFSSGNIPVDRKSKDRHGLFKGTIEALAKGEAVALFPEGTSYTEPRIMQVKDGAAWAALEYTKWAKDNLRETASQPVKIIPVSIVYTNKSKYRSSVIMEFGRPIIMDSFESQFFSEKEGASRSAVKSLTRVIETELVGTSINAPDWDSLYVAKMARELLWENEKSIKLEDFVAVSQTLVDLFASADLTPNFKSLKRHLLGYYFLLQSSHLSNSVLASLPLPPSLDPNTAATVPSRLYTLLILLRDSVSALIQLPFFALPLLIHAPTYVMSRIGAKLVEDEEETQAQNKVAFGLISLLLIYPAIFSFLWALFWYTRLGALLAAMLVYLFAVYHNNMIDGNYERAKRFIAAWRVLVGVWTPKKWDISLSALSEYTTPPTPPANPWIDGVNQKMVTQEGPTEGTMSRAVRRPPSRRLVRHVLRSRVEAINALAGFFDHLEGTRKVKASPHLARMYGGGMSAVGDGQEWWRKAGEVIEFLRQRGAKIPSLGEGVLEDAWAVSSEGEGTGIGEDKEGPL